MFCGQKDDVERVVEILRKEICCYMGDTCDCKYGYKGNRDRLSEQTGCPELRTVLELLKNMTAEEYDEILGRNRYNSLV